MYLLLIVVALALATWMVVHGKRSERRAWVVAGTALLVGTWLLFTLLDLLVELWWFDSLGYEHRFWTEVVAQAATSTMAAVAMLGVVWLLTLPLPRSPRAARLAPRVLAVVFGLLWGWANWQTVLLFLNRTEAGVSEPIHGRDAGFYLFTLPLLDGLFVLALVASLLPLLGWGALFFRQQSGATVRGRNLSPSDGSSISRWAAPMGLIVPSLVVGWGMWLRSYHLLFSSHGAVQGPGYTDVTVRLPALYALAVLIPLLALLPFVPGMRSRLDDRLGSGGPSGVAAVSVPILAMVALIVLGLAVVPNLVQWLRVEPNEISLEEPYIEHNIRLTRHGFGLHDVEVREYPATGQLDSRAVQANQDVLSEVRLWDWRALDAVYKQFQEIRLYYEFADVDIDRYQVGEDYRQVMVSAREMEIDNLPADSQTFVNRRFKYTHGYGLTLAGVNEFTSEGLPQLLVRDLPPVAEHPSLEVREPSIYYGELTREHVVVNTEEEEFHFPRGDQNAYTHYEGTGGVELRNLWRKFALGWRFDGTRFFFSTYPTAESRVLFHRQVIDRVRTLAPFLDFDGDPYVTLVDGELHWIVDAYTSSAHFPYSEPYDSRERIEYRDGETTRGLSRRTLPWLDGRNYVRNSVKATIDAYDGTVRFYVFESDDPLIRAWRAVYPDLFLDRDAMPPALEAHVRYPVDLLLAQGLVYAKYHMEDPEVFYNQEDLWVRATEKYHAAVQPVEPYYVMWKPEVTEDIGLTLIQPFTPKNRQVLIGWIAGLCDSADYGRLLAYQFPKERRLLGPQQVETKIDQDSYLSGQLSLWDQRGSQVIRGNVLAIPIADTLLYVEPIYLQADTAAYPELRLVVVMHGDRMSFAETFDEAMRGLIEGAPSTASRRTELGTGAGARQGTAAQARDAFESYLELQGQGRFREAASQLERLRDLLDRLVSRSEPATPASADELEPTREDESVDTEGGDAI